MTAVGLVFLVVCIFGAFAYGSATLMALRQIDVRVAGAPPPQRRAVPPDGVSLTMFSICTVWFAHQRGGGAAPGDTGPARSTLVEPWCSP